MLIYKSVTIYLLPCIGVYVGRASWGFIGTFCCFLCKCCGCYYYKDTGFDGVLVVVAAAALAQEAAKSTDEAPGRCLLYTSDAADE